MQGAGGVVAGQLLSRPSTLDHASNAHHCLARVYSILGKARRFRSKVSMGDRCRYYGMARVYLAKLYSILGPVHHSESSVTIFESLGIL